MERKELHFEWLYDLEARVEMTNPDEIVRVVSNVKPAKYLVLPGSPKVFPDQYLRQEDGIWVIKTDDIKTKSAEMDMDTYDLPLDASKPGDIYPVTLVKTAKMFNIESLPLIITDGKAHEIMAQTVIVRDGIEKAVSESRQEFITSLNRCGIKADASKAYARIELYTHENP